MNHLAIPEPDARSGFRFLANGQYFESLLSISVYCDSLSGISGDDREEDPVVADLVTAGRILFTSRQASHVVTPGRICIRDTKASWEFYCEPATRVRVVTIPRHLVFSRAASPGSVTGSYLADVSTPEVRFLLNFLEAVEKSRDDLHRSASAQALAADACTALFSGMLFDQRASAIQDHPNATVTAARNFIEKNLGSTRLSPAMVAQNVGVSLRTLQRSFSDADDTVMAFVRRRRLQSAHAELRRLGGTARISEIAARWQFADASHFIRNFKATYGSTPASYLRNLGGRGTAE
ncbi:helix-turn-helix transcriptional regulator [Streptomyces seoulensis]|uniref:helix-turn-helix transcriptional regulator n=1 Tax=Streptomyces seoulensis TaxID=73044 RepID=UPI000B0042D4|nr:helix-turn-helix transcriptional regulator [Streptomyces seoulensis]